MDQRPFLHVGSVWKNRGDIQCTKKKDPSKLKSLAMMLQGKNLK